MHFKGLWRALFVALKQNTYTAFNASRKWVLKFPMRNVRQNTLRISSDCFFFHFTTDFCACVYSASCNRIKIDAQQVLTGTICSGLPLPLCSMLNWSCHKIRDAKLNFIVCIWSDQTPVIHRRTKCSTKKKKEVKIYFRHRWGARAFGNVWRKIWPLWKRSKTKSRQIMNEKLCYEFSSMITLSNSLRHLQGKRFLRMCFVATTWETLCGHTMPSQHKSTHTKRKNQKLPAAIRIRREGD